MSQGIINFVVVGAKNSGKTVFLSTLFGMESSLATANKETTEYLKANWNELKTGALPSATSSRVITLEFKYKTDEYSVGFDIDDYDGYFVETLGTDEEQTQEDRELLRKKIEEAEGLLFFFPFEKKIDEESMERFQYEINTFIQLIKDVYPDQKDLPIPVVIAVSKWDRSPHFRAQDEYQNVIDYIDSVEAYQASMKMVRSFFSDVKIEPVSSFGKTDDGIHPVKGRIDPYNLRGPFEYFLKVTFEKFENKAEKLKASNDLETLYSFLTTIYNDVRFFKEGKLIKLHSVVENEYSTSIIEKLKSAKYPSEQNEIISDNSFLLSNIKNKDLLKKIKLLVSIKKAKKNRRTIVIGSAILSALLCFGYGLFAYKAYEKEKITFLTIQKINTENSLKDFDDRCNEYLKEYKGKSIFLPFTDIVVHRQHVEAGLSSAKSIFVKELTEVYNVIKSQDPNERNLSKISELQARAELFPTLEISQRIMDLRDQFSTRLERRQEVASIVNEAKSLLASDSDLSEIENILGKLNDLPDDGEVPGLRIKLSQRLDTLQLQAEFNQLYNEVKEAKRVQEIKQIVGKKWRSDFQENFAQTLRGLIQEKVTAIDSAAINDLQLRFEYVIDFDEQIRMIEEIGSYCIDIPQLTFHYERSQYIKNKFEEAKNSTAKYKKVLDYGVPIRTIKFGANSKKNDPLGFACESWSGRNNEIFVKIINDHFNVNISHKNSTCCNNNTDGSQVMFWSEPGHLRSGVYHVDVTEDDMAMLLREDDHETATISVSKAHLLQLFNDGQKRFSFPNNTYYFIEFTM